MGLARKNRLTKTDNFSVIKKRGKRIVSGAFVYYVCSGGRDVSRLAVVVSSKLGIACRRNRLKRRVREVFRLNMKRFNQNVDIIAIPQKSAVSMSYSGVEKHFLNILKKSGIFLKLKA